MLETHTKWYFETTAFKCIFKNLIKIKVHSFRPASYRSAARFLEYSYLQI